MPNRIIKESICTSDSIDELSWLEECFFYRLIVNCDDYGRMDARPKILKSKLFPMKDNLTLKDVENALRKLVDAGCVETYEYEGKPYLYLPAWEVHQTVRAKKSKYPDPEEVLRQKNAHESICKQMQADVHVIQSNPNPIRNPNTETRVMRFQEFAELYPKDGAGTYAVGTEYVKATFMVSEDDLIAAVKNYAEACSIKKTEAQYILNPENFLKKQVYEQYVPENYKRPDAPKPKNKVEAYNQMMSRDYDFESLEKELLGGGG